MMSMLPGMDKTIMKNLNLAEKVHLRKECPYLKMINPPYQKEHKHKLRMKFKSKSSMKKSESPTLPTVNSKK